MRAPGTELDDLPLSQGRLAVGRAPEGGLRAVDDAAPARVSFCADRRGTWLQVGEGVRGVHVNGRPVQRKALLRAGDTVFVDGVEIGLVRPSLGEALLGKDSIVGAAEAATGSIAASAAPTTHLQAETDPRIVLRGTSGPHHGRSLTLERPRTIGSADVDDIRVEALAARHAQVAMEGSQAVLRVLARDAEVLVNGAPCRSALLQPGDQVAFDAHHRFVLEAPTPVLGQPVNDDDLDPLIPREELPPPAQKPLRMPWLLLAALLLAAALSALLLL